MSNFHLPVKKYLFPGVLAFAIVIIAISMLSGVVDLRTEKEKQVDRGAALAPVYCSNCHQYPKPSLLDKKTWEDRVLPAMATRLKLENFHAKYGVTVQSAISVTDFEAIVAFYKNSAPQRLPIPADTASIDWSIFSLQKPAGLSNKSGNEANTLMLNYNPADGRLYTGDMQNEVYSWDADLKPALVAKMPSPAVHANFYQSGGKNMAVVTCIGILNPNDLLKGSITALTLDKAGQKPMPIAENLSRPVQTVTADFNKDGLLDYATCGFGNNQGNLYLFTQQADHNYKKSVIRAMPGSEGLVTGDFNNDGFTDLMCLFAQADEGIWMFLNNKKGGFIEKNILHFPPVYGSSSFQLVDFNHDGKLDILYTCGDNSDLSPILKPYHGIYIFTNVGDWKFKQSYFYHLNGASKAVAADFDHDGDLDIAAISYFPDFLDHPQQGFTYLEQTGPAKFKAHEVPVNKYGRWIAMEVADINNDGYPDIALGNFSVAGRGLINQKGVKQDWDKFMPLIVLKNEAGKSARQAPANSK
ncbi:VCBS repeat-containing protein [Mucilaginibacter sp. L3T2-6]|uniref:FG-GAP repeat domain-containing protein n=1 Tax=Mucilaginibacter sp. L3T2-6 TaxID=3062491 RepID=UPI0026774F53|nr:VCBS repeat-containing protein [Mucilaginibacter sp. L3T2-6]MDO3642544.1 VCBS repeat-containing protein [Mucilaginibacter sp. L3T2-6]MDV6215060.1 VCBS repeat-containing protein [Mucilaginibacter sp. L3T2-6]